MDEIASLEWDIVPKEDYKYDWVKEEIEEVKNFLNSPNKNKETFADLIRALIKDVLEIDAGVIVKVFDINSYDFNEIEPKSGAPTLKPFGQRRMTEIYIRDGASFLKEIDKFGFCKGYWQYSYQIPAHPMWFNRDEIYYISEHNRSMSCYGYARTQAILEIIKSLHYSTLYNKRFFEESPIPDGALSLLDTNEVEMKSFMSYWNNEFKAQPHKVAVTNKDLKWQPFAVSQRELEFLETQKWYFNIVISAFGLTPSELGITDDLNRATSATQAELVKRKGIRPFLKLIENALNKGILPEFGYEGIEFQFIYDDPAEKKAKLDNWQIELSIGVKTINEVRNELGLEPIEGGDVSNNMMSRLMSQTSEPNTMPSDEENREAQGYQENVKREETKGKKEDYEEVKEELKNPYSTNNRPIGNFKGMDLEKPGMGRSDEWWKIYHALRSEGYSKERAARIASSKTKSKTDYSISKESNIFELMNDGEKTEILRSSIASELAAISLYENMASKTNDSELKAILLDIAREEKVHVGEFQIMLDKLDKENEEAREEGINEAQEITKQLGIPKSEQERAMTHFNFTEEEWNKLPLEEQQDYIERLPPRGNKLKGIDDGQYYHDQPITQPSRPSGANFQPQNPKPNNEAAMPTLRIGTEGGLDTNPSPLGTSYAKPTRDLFESNKDLIYCPICGQPTLTYLNSLESMEDDIRCTACGARFRSEDLLGKEEMEEMHNVLHQHNISNPIAIPSWTPKGFTKSFDDNLNIKDYCGFDVTKAFPFAFDYADEKAYEQLIKKYLSDLPVKQIKAIISILKDSLRSSINVFEVANKINEIIKDPERASLIARTEIIRIANEGNLMRMEEKGTDRVMFISAPEDGRLCEICKGLDGKIFTLNEAKGKIPVHPRCRCTWTEYEGY